MHPSCRIFSETLLSQAQPADCRPDKGQFSACHGITSMLPFYRRKLRRSTAKLWERTESSRTGAARYLCAVLPQPRQRHSLSRSSSHHRRKSRGCVSRFRVIVIRALEDNSGGAAAARRHRAGRGRGKRREQRAAEEEQGTEGGQPPAPPRSTKPRGRATDTRAEGGRGTGNRPAAKQTGRRFKRPGAGRPTDTLRPPRGAAPRTARMWRAAAVRNKAPVQYKRTCDPNQSGRRAIVIRSPPGRARPRKLGAGITALTSANALCASAPARSDMDAGFAPAGIGVGSAPGRCCDRRKHSGQNAEQSRAAGRGRSPARQPEGLPGDRTARRCDRCALAGVRGRQPPQASGASGSRGGCCGGELDPGVKRMVPALLYLILGHYSVTDLGYVQHKPRIYPRGMADRP